MGIWRPQPLVQPRQESIKRAGSVSSITAPRGGRTLFRLSAQEPTAVALVVEVERDEDRT
jgi:hypothetical protein